MKRITIIIAIIYMGLMLLPLTGMAQNPIVQTIYTADPAPMVYNDTVYLYTGHDEDTATYFRMNDWRVFSSSDMVNWTHRGTPLSYKTFSWASGDAWAAQCIQRNGKFYWYVTLTHAALGRPAIGVAVSDSPTGPFIDVLGTPLIAANWYYIDPTVFIDDDGQAYLYWGNNNLWYVKLNEDMISYSGDIVKVDVKNKPAFGSDFEEAPWVYKRNGQYYNIYAAGGVPEHIAYSTSDKPTGPWVYQDTIMSVQGGAFTNHPGIIDFKGHSYFFYHNAALSDGNGFRRSVCVEEFKYLPDGTIPAINMTKAGVINSLANLNPFHRQEAETIAWQEGVETASSEATGVYVTDVHNGAYIKVRSVDFGQGAKSFQASTAAKDHGASIEIRLDSPTGQLIGICEVKRSGGMLKWEQSSCRLSQNAGVHDVYFVFKGKDGKPLFNFDWWQFN